MDFKEVLDRRRAINFFDPGKPVSDERLRNLIEMAAKAPSSFNLQPWNLMVLKDPDESKKLHPPKWRKTFEEIVVKFD